MMTNCLFLVKPIFGVNLVGNQTLKGINSELKAITETDPSRTVMELATWFNVSVTTIFHLFHKEKNNSKIYDLSNKKLYVIYSS